MNIEDSDAFKIIIKDYYENIAKKGTKKLSSNILLQKLKLLQANLEKIRLENSNDRQDCFASLLQQEILQNMNKKIDFKPAFGETVYNKDVLRPVNKLKMYDLHLVYEIKGNKYL